MTDKRIQSPVRKAVLAVVFAGLLLGGSYSYRLIWGQPLNINHFADRSTFQLLWYWPEMATMLGMIENTPLDFHSGRLTDVSPAGQQHVQDIIRNQYAMLQEYDREELAGQQLLTWDYLDFQLSTQTAVSAFPWHFNSVMYQGPYPANQLDGLQSFPLNVLTEGQQVVDGASAERYLKRVAGLPDYMNGLLEAMRYRQDMEVIPPRIIVQRLIEQATQLVETPAPEWGIYLALVEKLQATDLSDSEQKALNERNRGLIASQVIPAFRDYLAYLVELEPKAPDEVGLWHLPDGLAYYQALLLIHTSSDRSAEQIHQLGLRRVEEIAGQMDTALQAFGFTEGTIGERMQAFASLPGIRYETGEDAREEILADFTKMEEALKTNTAQAFLSQPPQPLEVRAVPEDTQDGSPAAYYYPAALDGSRPGVFYVNLRSPQETERHGMLTLAAHEGIPGHHFELSVSQELADLPLRRRVGPVTSYSEGWALYTERLVYELGLHDEKSNLGRLQSEMFRAVRLVVDTGLHAKGWTREQAIDYMTEYTGMPRTEVVAEIERYIVLPGQACAYMVGMLEILDLREAARARLGDRFNLPDFHQAVLSNGPLPMPLLRREVEAALF